MKPPRGPGMGTGVTETGHFLCAPVENKVIHQKLWICESWQGMVLVLTELGLTERVPMLNSTGVLRVEAGVPETGGAAMGQFEIAISRMGSEFKPSSPESGLYMSRTFTHLLSQTVLQSPHLVISQDGIDKDPFSQTPP